MHKKERSGTHAVSRTKAMRTNLMCTLAFVLKTALVRAPAARRAVCSSSFVLFVFFVVKNCAVLRCLRGLRVLGGEQSCAVNGLTGHDGAWPSRNRRRAGAPPTGYRILGSAYLVTICFRQLPCLPWFKRSVFLRRNTRNTRKTEEHVWFEPTRIVCAASVSFRAFRG